MVKNIIWDKIAVRQLKILYETIATESPHGAITVREGILASVAQIAKYPYRHPADSFKINNSGNYRAFELYNYRIAYKITDEHIQILRVRHVKQEPLKY